VKTCVKSCVRGGFSHDVRGGITRVMKWLGGRKAYAEMQDYKV
jgi:hypothetical protein